MANEVAAASMPQGQRAVARFQGSLDRLRTAQVKMFQARQAIGLASPDAEPPEPPPIEATSGGFLQQLESIAAAFDDITKEIGADIDAIATAFR